MITARRMKPEPLGALLVRRGALTSGDVALGLGVQASSAGRERLGNILRQYALVREEDLMAGLSEQSGWPVYEGAACLDQAAASRLGGAFMQEHLVLPCTDTAGTVFVLADPYDTRATDQVVSVFGSEVRFFIGNSDTIAAGAAHFVKAQQGAVEAGTRGVQDAADSLLEEAIDLGATDIHIEPSGDSVEVRLRLDGVLRFHRSFARGDHARIVNIFFNRAEISAGDFMKLHDARFDHVCGNRRMDIRLSHIPSVNGASLVLRLLDKTRSAVPLESLGYAPGHCRVIERAVKSPGGIVLLTGPTGCGKTTSLYAMLNHVKAVGIKVVAAEDPVEIKLPLVTQVPVDIRKGHDFHQLARAFLRHDPDIILIGEIRDEKTAKEAVRAAITGHKVFSTLHTRDAVSAILRLRDLGVDNSYIASTLKCVVAQRLVRKLCPHCRIEEFVTPLLLGEAEQAFVNGPGQIIHRADPRGCPWCFDGYRGRTVVAETLFIDDEIRFMIEQGLVNEIFLKVRARPGVITMHADACRLVREGVIAPEEAARVVR